MRAKVFFDTNVLIYAVAQNDPRAARAEELLAAGGMIGVQMLNEFVSVARRKLKMSWEEVNDAVAAILILCPSPLPIVLTTHESARKIAEAYGLNFYDALVVAVAMQSGSGTLYSEDFQDGLVIEGRLTVRNPFRR
jgi:predicted nucleic acid-binding protein